MEHATNRIMIFPTYQYFSKSLKSSQSGAAPRSQNACQCVRLHPPSVSGLLLINGLTYLEACRPGRFITPGRETCFLEGDAVAGVVSVNLCPLGVLGVLVGAMLAGW